MGETSARLKSLRDNANLSQSQVAYLDQVNQVTLSAWEAGNTPKALDTLARLARRYRTTADYLLGLTDDPAPSDNAILSVDQRTLADLYAELSTPHQRDLLAIAQTLAALDQEPVTAQADAQDHLLDRLEVEFGEEIAEKVIELLLAADADLLRSSSAQSQHEEPQ